MLSLEPNARLDLRILRLWPELKPRVGCLIDCATHMPYPLWNVFNIYKSKVMKPHVFVIWLQQLPVYCFICFFPLLPSQIILKQILNITILICKLISMSVCLLTVGQYVSWFTVNLWLPFPLSFLHILFVGENVIWPLSAFHWLNLLWYHLGLARIFLNYV